MTKLAVAVAAMALVLAGVAWANQAAGPTTLAPACPHATYGADGNMGPLFCVVDNPLAWKYFAPMAKRTFALGPGATPGQVEQALVADYKRAGTEPIICSIYRLAAWRNHWHFGVS